MNNIPPGDNELAKMAQQAVILGQPKQRPDDMIFECNKCGDRPPMVDWNPPGHPPHILYRVPASMASQLPDEKGVVWLCLKCQTAFWREVLGQLVPVDPNAPPKERKVVPMENRAARRKRNKR